MIRSARARAATTPMARAHTDLAATSSHNSALARSRVQPFAPADLANLLFIFTERLAAAKRYKNAAEEEAAAAAAAKMRVLEILQEVIHSAARAESPPRARLCG